MPGIPVPGGEENPVRPFTVEDFGSIDTKAKRPAIDPKNFAFIQNWMPIGPGNMRTLYAEEDTPLYTAPGGRTIIYYYFFNIADDEYAAVFLDDGKAYQIAVSNGASTTISATSGKFYTAGQGLPACAQWQSKYLLIAAPFENDGYWVWDGVALFGAGGLEPRAVVGNSGRDYTSAPTVTAAGGSGSGATFLAEVKNGSVTKVECTNPGSGYLVNEKVTLRITGGGSDDQASATATVDMTKGGLVVVQVTNGGHAYSSPQVAITGGGGTGALAFVSGAANGVVTEITVTNPGTGYTGAPTVTITDTSPGVGTGATAIGEIRRGVITAITVTNGGSGYVGMPDVIISEPDGLEFPLIQAEAYANISAGAVTTITITANGCGYRTATVNLSGGNDAAEAEIGLMPFGIAGGSIETYQGHVWIFEEDKYSFTAPDSVSDFGTSFGGGSKPVTDSFLRERIVAARQSNGFLYRFGDSSINVISNVQTASTGTTTFNDANVDAQIGSAWRDSVAPFGRALVFANPTGVYALYGGAAEKVSNQLDGLFQNASFNTGETGITPTAAVGTIFGIRVYILAFTTVNPFTSALEDMLALWDGQKWFMATQIAQPIIVGMQQINSQLTPWGCDGTHIYKMFQTPSAEIEKIFQTKLVASPMYAIENQVMRVGFIAQSNDTGEHPLSIAIDNQGGSAAAVETAVSTSLTWINNLGEEVTWTGLAAAVLTFTVAGLVIAFYDDSQFGPLIGATVRTEAEDLTLISLSLFMREFSPNI